MSFAIDGVQKVTIGPGTLYVEWGDSNWVKTILQKNEWDAIGAIAPHLVFEPGAVPVSITLKANSALGGGSLASVTSWEQLVKIGNFEMSETDWYAAAKFTVTGTLY